MSNDGKTAATTTDARAQEHLTRSVQARCPGVPADAIADRVRVSYQRYAQARVRDFVPLLVEREIVAELGAARTSR